MQNTFAKIKNISPVVLHKPIGYGWNVATHIVYRFMPTKD